MSRVRGHVICVLMVWFALVGLRGSGAAAAPSRPDGQALVFGVASNLTLSTFDGAMLAYQRFIRPNMAWRVSLGADLRYDSGRQSEHRVGVSEIRGSADISQWDYAVSLSSDLLAYRGDQTSVYFGGGPRITYSSVQGEGWRFYETYSRYSRHTSYSYGLGLQGCIGIQWAATDWVTLHAEYNARCTYLHLVDEYESTETGEYTSSETETEKTSRFFLDARGVRFGLSAYF